jgi:filamentous hemagglutinin family protein
MINKTNMKQLRYLKLLAILNLSIFWTVGLNRNYAFAQNNIVPDETLGNGKSRVVPFEGNSAIDTIQGGAISDSNLFHSFQEFNVNEDGSAYFANPEGITDIFSRVTGNNPSNIFGKLGVLGDANLFLINPNGIVFGENASLDVGGSFVASTANGIEFGEQGSFSASNPQAPRLLNVNPSALFFNQVAAQPIVNKSRADAGINPSGTGVVGLRVPNGKSLLLVGGDVNFEGGQSNALGGHLELGGLKEPGSIDLQIDDETLKLDFPSDILLGNVTLKDDARASVQGAGGGNLVVNADTYTATSGGRLIAGTQKPVNAGDVTVNANNFIITGVGSTGIASGLYNQATSNVAANSGNIIVNTKIFDASLSAGINNRIDIGAKGNVGDININADFLSLRNGSQIAALNFGQGNSGSIKINADTIEIIGISADRTFPSGVGSINSGFNSEAKAGNVTLNTRILNIRDGGVVTSQTSNRGKGGDLIVTARESLNISGIAPSNLSNNQFFRSGLTTSSIEGSGEVGNLKISDTGIIKVEDGGVISTSTETQGAGGNIEIDADTVEIIGTSSDRIFPSGLGSETLAINSRAKAGNVTLNTRILNIRDGGIVSTQTFNQGEGGDLTVTASESLNISGIAPRKIISGFAPTDLSNISSFISALSTSTRGSGKAGNLKIFDTGIIKIEDGGQISASTIGEGVGGNVEINADTVEIIGVSTNGEFRSNLVSETSGANFSAKAGDISLKTQTLNIRDGAVLSTQSFNQGKAGNINIQNSERIQLTNGSILSTSQQSSGGAINITAKDIRLFGDSDIATNVFSGEGGGGNINLNANTIIALDDSDILSFAGDGKGGDITFNTEAFFSKPLYNPSSSTNNNANALTELDNNNRVDVNASGTVSGTISGIPDTTFIQDNLTELPENQIDTNVLVASSCIVRNNQQNGTFFVTGAGGLPINPSDAPLSNYSTGSVQSIPITSEKLPSSTTQSSWEIGDPIVEPSGAYQLPNGQIVLSRECSK